MKELDKEQACNVLSVWSILEILSPQIFRNRQELVTKGNQSFRDKEDLTAEDNKNRVVDFQGNVSPWENKRKESTNQQLFYQIIVGTIDLNKAFNLLLEKYGKEDEDSERPVVDGEAIIAVILVDKNGHVVKNGQPVVTSSFAWGMPQALKGNLRNLLKWRNVKDKIENDLLNILYRKDKNGEELALDADTIEAACVHLNTALEIPSTILKSGKFAVINYTSKDSSPQSPILNSFFLEDLFEANKLIKKDTPPQTLLRYLGATLSTERHNILTDYSVLEEAICPKNIPAARWPGPGRYPLALLQQAAVNLSMNKLKENEILGINGPPGTGKTTLLRDVIASLVSKRAEALLKFDDPEQAFVHLQDHVYLGQSKFDLYKLDERLKGFEILIASSNNKAVENITTELPSLGAIDKGITDLRYFKTISDELSKSKETWGLVAAVLGNASNRDSFFKKFWPENGGLLAYLTNIINETHQKDRTNDSPAKAKERWLIARSEFKETLKKAREELVKLEEIRETILALDNLKQDLNSLENGLAFNEPLEDLIARNQKNKPHVLFRILGSRSARTWKKELKKLLEWQMLQQKVAIFPEKLRSHFFDKEIFKDKKAMHVLSPWCDQETQLLRDQVFTSAIKLHKAFIDAAAKPLLHNLGVFKQLITNNKNCSWPKNKAEYIKDLWSTFFLVVPTVSTTFASVSRMLQNVPSNTFGWLLIDEAGQATPQAAVGAIMRSKRAIITGDPLQIEPVVTLPSKLTEAICREFEVDARRFNAPKVSVQTLADQASSYFTEFIAQAGSTRTVGVPLLVHRRCTEPMFSISNKIAYGKLMVHAKANEFSSIRVYLGRSTWFDIQSKVDVDKWCSEEGEKVLELLDKLKEAAVFPHIYIITPFKNVANCLRNVIKESKILHGWPGVSKSVLSSWTDEYIGTVHTLQGREAEAVILVLGAQEVSDQRQGARMWAGGSPNLLNVTVTRAKEAIYVVGNRDLWKKCGVFEELHDKIQAYNSDLEKTEV